MTKLLSEQSELENIASEKSDIENYLDSIYYNPKHEASFSGLERLYSFVKHDKKFDIPKDFIEEWLHKQEVYTTHAVKKKSKFFSPVVVPGIKYQFDIDTAFLPSKSKKGLKQFILAIDVFSRRIAAKAVKNLKSKEVVEALREIFNEIGFPKKIRTDQGTEFKNKDVERMLDDLKIEHFVAYPPNKANYAERGIRSIKNNLYKFMQSHNENDWTDNMLQSIVEGYNKRSHTSIGIPPDKVKKSNEAQIWFRQKDKHMMATPLPSHFKFQLNDAVRVKIFKKGFEKDFQVKFSQQIYFIAARFTSYSINRYLVKTFLNETVTGSYSENELQKVIIDNETVYKIERVINRKTENGIKYVKVRWLGYDHRYDSWIEASELGKFSSTMDKQTK